MLLCLLIIIWQNIIKNGQTISLNALSVQSLSSFISLVNSGHFVWIVVVPSSSPEHKEWDALSPASTLAAGSVVAVRRLAEAEPMRGSTTEGTLCTTLTCDGHVSVVFAFVYSVHDLLGAAHKSLRTPLRTKAQYKKTLCSLIAQQRGSTEISFFILITRWRRYLRK